MQLVHMSQGHLLIDEVDVDLDVHHAAVMDGTDNHIDNANIVVVHTSLTSNQDMELREKLAKLVALGDDMSGSPILGLDTGVRHDGLSRG